MSHPIKWANKEVRFGGLANTENSAMETGSD